MQFCFTPQAIVYVTDVISRIACRMYEYNLHFRVIDKQANQFTCSISRTSYDTNLNHYLLLRF